MLAVMTMNVGYFMAVLGGTFLGSFVVGGWTGATGHRLRRMLAEGEAGVFAACMHRSVCLPNARPFKTSKVHSLSDPQRAC